MAIQAIRRTMDTTVFTAVFGFTFLRKIPNATATKIKSVETVAT